MAEYIEREQAIGALIKGFAFHGYAGNTAVNIIKDIPSADVVPKEQYEQDRKEWLDRYIKEHDARIETIKDYHDYQPVVHGHWIVRRGNWQDEYECSVCHHISKDGGNYCGNCGARMDEE